MKKAQGSLEYLIIIAAILAISGVVVYFVVGSSGESIGAAQFAECKKAANQCSTNQLLNPKDPCLACEDACVVNGKDIMADKDAVPSGCGSACTYCKLGDAVSIIEGGKPITPPGPPTDCTVDGEINVECTPTECQSQGLCDNGTCVYTNDDGAGCTSDGNECTDDRCLNGVCGHVPLEGNTCAGGAGTCDASGFCSVAGCFDDDGDGYGKFGSSLCYSHPGETDCDDNNINVNPGAEEICGDGIDNDCILGQDNGCPTAIILSSGVTTAESSWPLGSDCTEGTIGNVITDNSPGIFEFWNLDSATCAGAYEYKMTSQATQQADCANEPAECSWVTRHFTGMGVGVNVDIDYEVYLHRDYSYYDQIRVWVSVDGSSWSEVCTWNPGNNEDNTWISKSCSFLSPSSDFYVKIVNDPDYADYTQMSIRKFDVEIANKDAEHKIEFMASASPGATISKYEWDFNNDGTYEWSSDTENMFNYSTPIDCSDINIYGGTPVGNVITDNNPDVFEFWNPDTAYVCANSYGYKMTSQATQQADCANEPAECSWVTRHFTGVDTNVNVDIDYEVYLHRDYSYYDQIRVWVSVDGSSWSEVCTWNPGNNEDNTWISKSCSFLSPSSDFYVKIINDPDYADYTQMSIRKFDATFNAPITSSMDKVVYHTFGNTGTFTPKLRVTDSNGKQSTATVTYNIN